MSCIPHVSFNLLHVLTVSVSDIALASFSGKETKLS
jgi:hypothetical protein